MVEQLQAKRVPWSQLGEYLEVHQEAIAAYVCMSKRKAMDIPTIETKLPESFMELHKVIAKILKENDIIPK